MLSAGGRFRFFIPRDVALRCDAGRFAAGEFTATVPWPLVAHGTRTCGEPCFTFGEARTAFPRGLVGVGVVANSHIKILEEPSWKADTSFAHDSSVVPRLSFSSPQPIPDVPALSAPTLFLALPELTFQALSVATRCFRTPVVPLDQPQSRYSRGRSCKHYQRHSSAHFARSVPRVAD